MLKQKRSLCTQHAKREQSSSAADGVAPYLKGPRMQVLPLVRRHQRLCRDVQRRECLSMQRTKRGVHGYSHTRQLTCKHSATPPAESELNSHVSTQVKAGQLTWMAKIQTWRRISCAASVMGPRPDSVVVANRMTHMEMMLRDDSDTPAWSHDRAAVVMHFS